MVLWEEAPKVILAGGIQVYSWGLYCMIGTLAATAAVIILCRASGTKKGTGQLLSVLGIGIGACVSRLLFCLLNLPGGTDMPFISWFNFTTGGFSLFGMIIGVFLAAGLCAKITGESPKSMLDIVSCAIPLFVSAERIGERLIEGFNVSRSVMDNQFPAGSFLSVEDPVYGTSVLATWLLGAVMSIILFLILTMMLFWKKRQAGDQWIVFLLLCGAGGVFLESLRYDYHMEYSFVYFQQIVAAGMLICGVIMAGKRSDGQKKNLFRTAIISLPVTIGFCAFSEFALDRLDISHHLLYFLMAAVLSVPVLLGVCLITKRKKGNETA